MFNDRSPLIAAAAPAGLVAASLLWLLLGAHSGAGDRIDLLSARLSAVKPDTDRRGGEAGDVAARIVAAPLFALTAGPGAVAEIPLRLSGLAITRTHKAALISIGDKVADWLELGSTRDGVTLMEVQQANITVDTPTGFKSVRLGDGVTPEASVAPSSK